MPATRPTPDTDALMALLMWPREIALATTHAALETSIATRLAQSFDLHDYLVVVPGQDTVLFEVLLAHPQSVFHTNPTAFTLDDGSFLTRLTEGSPVLDTIDHTGLSTDAILLWKQKGIMEVLGVTLRAGGTTVGWIWFPLRKATVMQVLKTEIFEAVVAQLSLAVAMLMARAGLARQQEAIDQYKHKLDTIEAHLQGETDTRLATGDIIGTGPAMQKVFQRIGQVAFTNSTVLILGETGTGKEMVAQAIHNGSPRKEQPLVKVNCAALPATLIESELFGHERGSFTGATERRIGKFEMADKGTLFLDEIGEMPPELQVKLLRALQEKEIERVGGKSIIKVDVRIIAATNRHLEKEVSEGRFRKDLYYRLNVFPITLPPLRERMEDIPALVAYFINKFSHNAGKKITRTSRKALSALTAYHWPGNIRELEHLIERNMLMTTGNTLKEIMMPVTNRSEAGPGLLTPGARLKNFTDNERDHILQALKTCQGKIYGKGGAAEMLGLKVSTLNSKILKLGIRKEKSFRKKPGNI